MIEGWYHSQIGQRQTHAWAPLTTDEIRAWDKVSADLTSYRLLPSLCPAAMPTGSTPPCPRLRGRVKQLTTLQPTLTPDVSAASLRPLPSASGSHIAGPTVNGLTGTSAPRGLLERPSPRPQAC